MEKETEHKDCDCMSIVKQNIIDKVNADPTNPKGFKIVYADWEYKSWFPKVRLYVNFIIKNTFTKVNGTESKAKNNHINIFFTYCPFCGNKFCGMKDIIPNQEQDKEVKA